MIQQAMSLESVRGGLRASSDPRAQRTRRKLFAAVEALSASGDEISVRAIVEIAGVSRATFYTHFADLDELAVRMQQSAFDQIAEEARRAHSGSDTAAMLDSQRALVQHYAAHRALYAAVFALPSAPAVRRAVSEAMAIDVLAHIRDLEAAGALPAGIRPEIAAEYIADAATGVIVAWLTGRFDADVETVAQHLLDLMPRWMHRGTPGPAGTPGELN